jgi:hypothetical protein
MDGEAPVPGDVTAPGAQVRTLVVTADEERVMDRQARQLLFDALIARETAAAAATAAAPPSRRATPTPRPNGAIDPLVVPPLRSSAWNDPFGLPPARSSIPRLPPG